MKLKSRSTIIVVCVVSVFLVLVSGYFIRRFAAVLLADNTWITDLGYEEDEIHKLEFNWIGDRTCPEVPIKIVSKTFSLTFDTGCGAGMLLTDLIEDKTDYTLLNKIEQLNRDGSHRGWSKGVKIDEITVFGEAFQDVTTTIADWTMFSSSKFNGLIGLAYFDSKVITLDYEGHRIGVSSNPRDYTKLKENEYAVLPLYKALSEGQQDLLFFEARYHDQPVIVYLDTGKNHSYLYNPDCNSSMGEKPRKLFDLSLKIGSLELMLKDIEEVNDIAQDEGLPYQTMIELNSDQIWKCKLLVTVDLIEQKIIFKKR